ncbi:MAG: adenosylcobinamide-GDP ribazoletransferase [Solirubrobacteraceae bacterium]
MRTALSFLTVLPVSRRHVAPDRRALLCFPLAGLTLGALWALAAWGGASVWSPPAAAALVLAVDLVSTGALHVDAVADVADAIASRRPPGEALRIMREPQVGAAGAAAAAVALLLRFAWISVVVGAGLWPALVGAPVCGRAAMVVALAAGRRPRESSLARSLNRAATGPVAVAAVGSAAALAALAGTAAGGSAVGALGAGAALAAAITALGAERAWRARYGALTGDVVGAAGLAAETVGLATLALAPAALRLG